MVYKKYSWGGGVVVNYEGFMRWNMLMYIGWFSGDIEKLNEFEIKI